MSSLAQSPLSFKRAPLAPTSRQWTQNRTMHHPTNNFEWYTHVRSRKDTYAYGFSENRAQLFTLYNPISGNNSKANYSSVGRKKKAKEERKVISSIHNEAAGLRVLPRIATWSLPVDPSPWSFPILSRAALFIKLFPSCWGPAWREREEKREAAVGVLDIRA